MIEKLTTMQKKRPRDDSKAESNAGWAVPEIFAKLTAMQESLSQR